MNHTTIKLLPGRRAPVVPLHHAAPGWPGRPAPATGNVLLDALDVAGFEQIAGAMRQVSLQHGETLFGAGDTANFTYFPVSAVVSLVYAMEDGNSTEVAMIGREGCVGLPELAPRTASLAAVVQAEGSACVVDTAAIRRAISRSQPLTRQLIDYVGALLGQIAMTAVSSQHSTVEQRLSRWLLERLDRAASPELHVTQGEIALLLGVRREGVTAAVGSLQRQGCIHSRRCVITVVDRRNLERHAGECYQPRTDAPGRDALSSAAMDRPRLAGRFGRMP